MMKKSKKRTSLNVEERDERLTEQPKAAIESAAGYGDKKLDGPNRPST
ncbi:hypothetical protein [Ammoniphilus oxalaticus]|nr:hypothetical protein [Ammoniphilus oxalaticus]